MDERYRFFDKTADAKFQAFGVTLEEAFKNAQEAMVSLMFKVEDIAEYDLEREEREILVEGANLEALLYNFLEEAIFLLNAELFIGLAENVMIKQVDDRYKLKAVLKGTQSINFESSGDVKAVTYNEMYVKYDDEKEQYEVQVVVDL